MCMCTEVRPCQKVAKMRVSARVSSMMEVSEESNVAVIDLGLENDLSFKAIQYMIYLTEILSN